MNLVKHIVTLALVTLTGTVFAARDVDPGYAELERYFKHKIEVSFTTGTPDSTTNSTSGMDLPNYSEVDFSVGKIELEGVSDPEYVRMYVGTTRVQYKYHGTSGSKHVYSVKVPDADLSTKKITIYHSDRTGRVDSTTRVSSSTNWAMSNNDHFVGYNTHYRLIAMAVMHDELDHCGLDDSEMRDDVWSHLNWLKNNYPGTMWIGQKITNRSDDHDDIRDWKNNLNSNYSSSYIAKALVKVREKDKSWTGAMIRTFDDINAHSSKTVEYVYDIWSSWGVCNKKNYSWGNLKAKIDEAYNAIDKTYQVAYDYWEVKGKSAKTICTDCGTSAPTDIVDPVISYEDASQCSPMDPPTQFQLSLVDSKSGIDVSSIEAYAKFGGGRILPFALKHKDENDYDRISQDIATTGLQPTYMVLVPDEETYESQAIYDQFLTESRLSVENGGQKPWELLVKIKDVDGASALLSVPHTLTLGDVEKPALSIEGNPSTGVSALNKARFVLDDEHSDGKGTGVDIGQTSLTMTYGDKTFQVDFDAKMRRDVNQDECVARLPLKYEITVASSFYNDPAVMEALMDSADMQDPLQFTVSTVDYSGNSNSQSFFVKLRPSFVELGGLNLPSLAKFFPQPGKNYNAKAKLSQIKTDQSVTETRLYARLENAEDTPFYVNGKLIVAGDSVDLGVFSADQDFTFKVKPSVEDVSTEATVVIMSTDPRVRHIKIPVETWEDKTKKVFKNQAPMQIFEDIEVSLTDEVGSGCWIATQAYDYASPSVVNDPVCFVEWGELPEGLKIDPSNMSKLIGRIDDNATYNIDYQVYLAGYGEKILLDTDEMILNVSSAEAMTFGLPALKGPETRLASRVQYQVGRTSSEGCSALFNEKADAIAFSETNKPACIVEWTQLPEGIKNQPGFDNPTISGIFEQPEGDAEIRFSVAAINNAGEYMLLHEEAVIVPLIDPKQPTITLSGFDTSKSGHYIKNTEADRIGSVSAAAANADLFFKVWMDGELITNDVLHQGYSDEIVHNQYIEAPETNVWDVNSFRIEMGYVALPEGAEVLEFDVVTVQDDSTRAKLSIEDREVLSIDDIAINANMINIFTGEYDPVANGEWKTTLYDMSSSSSKKLTAAKTHDTAGKAVFEMKAPKTTSGTVRIGGVSEVISPISGFAMEVDINNLLYLTVLPADPIAAQVRSMRVQGEAPLKSSVSVGLYDRNLMNSVGNITWYERNVSEGSDWEVVEEGERVLSYRSEYPAGIYEVKAVLTNIHSQTTYETASLTLVSYTVPDVEILGDKAYLMGNTAELNLSVTDEFGEEIPEDNLDVQWSEDRGETWTAGGKTYSVQRDEAINVPVRALVQLKDQAQHGIDFERDDFNVSFKELKPPRARIQGARRIEVGDVVNWVADLRPPYPGKDFEVDGYFVLPNGESMTDTEVDYYVEKSDLVESPEVRFVSWVKGHKDETLTQTVMRLDVWEYVWPNWVVRTHMRTNQAPAEIKLDVTSLGMKTRVMEELTYEWFVPAGLEITSYYDDRRNLELVATEPGHYDVSVRIRDGRGHETVKEIPIDIVAADPWDIEFREYLKNDQMRAPLGVLLSPKLEGGHPTDAPEQYAYYLNGELLEGDSKYFRQILPAGDHMITFEMTTRFGDVITAEKEMTVLPNIAPVCELKTREYTSSWRYYTNCTDEGGKVVDYRWTVNGEVLPSSSSSISVIRTQNAERPTVSVVGIDDGGMESEEQFD